MAIEYRWAENQYRSTAGAGGRTGSPPGRRDRRDRRTPSALAAKAATTTIPIVFTVRRPGQAWSCRQPRPAGRQRRQVSISSVASWAQSGWNSCVSWCPQPTRVAVLVNPTNADTEPHSRDVAGGGARHRAANSRSSTPAPAARSMRPSQRLRANGADALFVGADPFFDSRRCNLPHWRRATRFPRHIRCANMPKPAG